MKWWWLALASFCKWRADAARQRATRDQKQIKAWTELAKKFEERI